MKAQPEPEQSRLDDHQIGLIQAAKMAPAPEEDDDDLAMDRRGCMDIDDHDLMGDGLDSAERQ